MSDEKKLPDNSEDNHDFRKKVTITSFMVIDNDDGLQVKMSNDTEMKLWDGLPKSVKGTVEIDGMVIPIIDLQAKKGGKPQEINCNSCIVLQQQNDGKQTIVTGAFHEDVSAVLDIIKNRI